MTLHVAPRKTEADAPYADLRRVLLDALADAAHGKGAERHAGGSGPNVPSFGDQPMMRIGRVCGVGFPLGQALKKIEEAILLLDRGAPERAIAELRGAIVYSAGAILLVEVEAER